MIILRNNKREKEAEVKEDEQSKGNLLKVIAQSVKESGFLSASSPLEKMRKQMSSDENIFTENIFQAMATFDGQIETAIEQEKPDVFILDNFLVPPALQKHSSTLPWVLSVSAQPLCIFSHPKLPPFGGGL